MCVSVCLEKLQPWKPGVALNAIHRKRARYDHALTHECTVVIVSDTPTRNTRDVISESDAAVVPLVYIRMYTYNRNLRLILPHNAQHQWSSPVPLKPSKYNFWWKYILFLSKIIRCIKILSWKLKIVFHFFKFSRNVSWNNWEKRLELIRCGAIVTTARHVFYSGIILPVLPLDSLFKHANVLWRIFACVPMASTALGGSPIYLTE